MAGNSVNFERCQEQQGLFQEGPVVIFKWVNDPHWTVEMVTGNIQQLLDCSADELVDNQISYKQFIHPEDLDRVIYKNTSFSRGGQKHQQNTYRLIAKSGRIIWVNDYTVAIPDENGLITHYLGYLIDITERETTEQGLRESEKKFRTLLDNLQNAVFLHKYQAEGFTNFVEVNNFATELYGYTKGEFYQLSAESLFPQEEGQQTGGKESRQQLLTTGTLILNQSTLKSRERNSRY